MTARPSLRISHTLRRALPACQLFQFAYPSEVPHLKTGPALTSLRVRSVSITRCSAHPARAPKLFTAFHNLILVGRSWAVRGPIAGCHSYVTLGSFGFLIRLSRQV